MQAAPAINNGVTFILKGRYSNDTIPASSVAGREGRLAMIPSGGWNSDEVPDYRRRGRRRELRWFMASRYFAPAFRIRTRVRKIRAPGRPARTRVSPPYSGSPVDD